MLAAAIHMSDVSFFWEMARSHDRLPWAVTANIAFKKASLEHVRCVTYRYQPLWPCGPVMYACHEVTQRSLHCICMLLDWTQSSDHDGACTPLLNAEAILSIMVGLQLLQRVKPVALHCFFR